MKSPFANKDEFFRENEELAAMLKKLTEQAKNESGAKKSAITSLLAILGKLVMFFLAWLYCMFAYGYVGSIMWKWFIVSTFDLPVLGWLQMAGLFFIVKFFVRDITQLTQKPDETTPEKIFKYLLLIVYPWTALFFAYLLHCLM